MKLVALAVLAVTLAGCFGADYSLTVSDGERSDRPARTTAPTVLINDVETTELHESVDTSSDEVNIVELRYDGHVIAHYERPVGPLDCDGAWDIESASDGIASYASGDLRFGSRYVKARGCSGISDGFALPPCSVSAPQGNCGAGKCSARVTLLEPLFSHLGCAPAGTKALGEACAFNPDGAELVDDCQSGLVCVASACRQICHPPFDVACDYVDGMPPEIGVAN